MPDPLQKAILKFGYGTASDFVSAFPDADTLNALITKLLAQDEAADLVVEGMGPLHSPAAGRLRRLIKDSRLPPPLPARADLGGGLRILARR